MRFFPRNLSPTFLWAWAHGSVTALEQWNAREEEGLLGAGKQTEHMDGEKAKSVTRNGPHTFNIFALAYSSFPCSWTPKLSRH